MKYILILSFLMLTAAQEKLSAQSYEDEASFLTMVVPTQYVKKNSEPGVDLYESRGNRSLLSMSKEYKGLEDSFLSAQSAADFTYKTLSADEINADVNVVTEKVGKLQFSIVSWVERQERKRIVNHMRAYNDDGQFIHCFEMSSSASNKKQLDKAFRSFLKTCRPIK